MPLTKLNDISTVRRHRGKSPFGYLYKHYIYRLFINSRKRIETTHCEDILEGLANVERNVIASYLLDLKKKGLQVTKKTSF